MKETLEGSAGTSLASYYEHGSFQLQHHVAACLPLQSNSVIDNAAGRFRFLGILAHLR